MKFVVPICEFIYMYLDIWARHKGWLGCRGATIMHSMYGLSRAGHMHLGKYHVNGSSHEGMVYLGMWLLKLSVFIVKHCVVGWASSVFASA
jgi:hypothetical protein